MKRNKKILKRKEKGITLIALVITIIVLLILAGVSIAMLTGENGILTQAQRAKSETEEAQEKEEILLALNTLQIDDNGYKKVTKEEFQKEIDKQFGEGKADVYENGYNAFSIIFKYEDKNYRIEEDGTINKIDIALKITNEEEFKEFAEEVNNGNSFEEQYVYLLNDLDLNNQEFDTIGYYVDTDNNQPFAGIFEGNNKKISGININKPGESTGMFPYNTGTIRDLILESGNITADVAGGFTRTNTGEIINCANKVNINVSNHSGGVAYNNQGKIIASYNEGRVEGNGMSIGGLVGWNNGGIIASCYNIGDVINNKEGGSEAGQTGGIIGANDGEVRNSYNVGSVNTTSDCTGGIVGINRNRIISCYNLGNVVSSTISTGGIVGYVSNSPNIENCINSGNVESLRRVGGIIGYASGSVYIDNCKSNATLKGTESIGGIVGHLGDNISLNISNCKWYANSEVSFGIGSTSSNENATYVENLQLESVIDIVNGENKFKTEGEKVVLKWQ